MPADSNLPNLPESPLKGSDLWLINRAEKSYKVTTFDMGLSLIDLEMPTFCDVDSDCPPSYECENGLCVRVECDTDKYPGTGCPTGSFCFNGYCYPICGAPGAQGCAEGNVCVDIDGGGNYICVPYPFPCIEGNCPNGYTCLNGNCYQLCAGSPGAISGANCPVGSSCIDIGGGISICVPYPYPCGSIELPSGDPCPPGSTCYNGECVKLCGTTPCPTGFNCTDIGGGIQICLPDNPKEHFVNDGPLIIRTEPLTGPAEEQIIFTANQFGRSILTFKGFIPSFDNPNDPGGGSGGGINIEVDPDWIFDIVGSAGLWKPAGVSGSNDIQPQSADGNVLPNGTCSLGDTTNPWANIYTQDMHFSNEGTEGNSVDGTTGDWTLQEGEDNVYMINNKTGKKYKFLMEEVN